MKRDRNAAFRGQPLVLLILLLAGWGMLRAAFWEAPFAPVAELERAILPQLAAPGGSPGAGALPLSDEGSPPGVSDPAPSAAIPRVPGAVQPSPGRGPKHERLPLLAGPGLMLTAGLAGMKIPATIAGRMRASARPYPAGIMAGRQRKPSRRMSADGWLLLRSGGGGGEAGAMRPGYGRSQAGAVLRYRLGAGSAHRPQLHVRASAALAGGEEREAAAGLSARPAAAIPLRLTAELRATRRGSGSTDLRPAAFAVTRIAPVTLPMATQAEFYLQAGYVGGDFATGFIDGQARIERAVARFGQSQLRAGGAAWGGAQRGAGRFDMGPSASVRFPVGDGYARLSLDYRVRIAGGAAPSSGPALALSAGF